MTVYKPDLANGDVDLSEIIKDIKSAGSAVALGRFDALHIGHAKIIKTAVEYAKDNNIKAIVFMFENEPSEVVTGRCVPVINTPDMRYKIFRDMGVDGVIEKKFDTAFMNLSCEEFIDMYLADAMGAKFVTAGFNYHFGKGGKGDTETLLNLCKSRGIDVSVASEVALMGDTVSSTRIRSCIKSGDIETATTLMDRNFEISGKVIHGNNIGSKIGFATANIPISPSSVVPKTGVYITQAVIFDKTYAAITNVGSRPTVDEEQECIETHIIGEDFGDLYGREITVKFFKYLRDIKRFSSVDKLAEQLNKDKSEAIKYLDEKSTATTVIKIQKRFK